MTQLRTKTMWVVASTKFPVEVITESGGTSNKIPDAQQFGRREEAEKRRQALDRPEDFLSAELTIRDRFEVGDCMGTDYELDARHEDNPPAEWLIYGPWRLMKMIHKPAELGEIKGGEDV